MFKNIRSWVLMMTMTVVGCSAGPNGFSDADVPDADVGSDASDDHKVGFKPDADNDSDVSDAGSQSDASDANPQDSGGTIGPRRAFVTFTSYNIGKGVGQFSGVAQADAICQATATSQALGGTWKAWLSSSAGSVAQRFTHTGGPFRMLDGTVIAKDWAELTSGTLQNKPSVDETGHPLLDQWVWTATLYDGTATTPSCNDWTTANTSDMVQFGKSMYTDGRWSGTGSTTTTTCNGANGIYCFEQ